MTNKIVQPNFIYPTEKDTEFKFGSAQLTGTPINPTGDWRSFVPPPEAQNKRGVESSACFVQSHQKALATLLEKHHGIPDSNFSERFNLIFSNATPQGGSPIDSGDSLRHDGVIPDSMLSFTDDIQSWDEFNSWKGGNEVECIKWGQAWLRSWLPRYDVVYRRTDTITERYQKLKEALKYSPCPVSVYGWVKDGEVYVKPDGVQDNHLCLCVYVDEQNCMWVWDTYGPDYLKKLAPNYASEFAMRWSLEKAPKKKDNWFVDLIKRLLFLK